MKTLLLLSLALLSDSVIIKDKIIYFERDGFEQVTSNDTTRIIFTGVKPYRTWKETIELINDNVK